MLRLLIAMLMLLSLAACKQNASDQPNAAESQPASAATIAPAAESTMAPETTATDQSAMDSGTATGAMGTTTDTGPVSAEGAATGTTGTMPTGQSDDTLEADLRRCDTLAASDQATCRTDAQSRYEQRAASGAEEPPANTP